MKNNGKIKGIFFQKLLSVAENKTLYQFNSYKKNFYQVVYDYIYIICISAILTKNIR